MLVRYIGMVCSLQAPPPLDHPSVLERAFDGACSEASNHANATPQPDDTDIKGKQNALRLKKGFASSNAVQASNRSNIP